MYKKIYHSAFKDINNNAIKIEILKDTDEDVIAKELLLSSDPVTIDYQGNDDVFHPLKCSGCKISVLTETLLLDLYSGKANEICCKIYRNEALLWFGFITPNIYNSDYTDKYNKLELEFIDAVSNLANYNYTYTTGKQAITSFYDIIVYILDKVDTDKVITHIYVQNSREINGSTDLLNELLINERNFYDEEEENEKCKDVLQYIAAYLGMTMIQFGNALYFVDYESFDTNNRTRFTRYSRTVRTATGVTLAASDININENVFKANASISLNDIYNKIVVIGNNNPIDIMIPGLFDQEDIINQNTDPNKYYEASHRIDGVDYTLFSAYFKSENKWTYRIPEKVDRTKITEITMDSLYDMNMGTVWQNVDYYPINNGAPSRLSWKKYLTFCFGGTYNGNDSQIPFLSLNTNNFILFKSGYFILNMRYRMSQHRYAHSVYKTSDIKFESGLDDTLIPCKLAIGNYYFDGEEWVSYDDYNLKVSRGYFQDCRITTSNDASWYYYIDQYGYSRYITKTHYNSLPASTVKHTGIFKDSNKVFYFNNASNTQIFVKEDYYHECFLRDKFYLVHKNKVGDKIFDEDKELTNTVSYKMNLVDAEDGVAIKLPSDRILQGKLIFELYKSNHLGTSPQNFKGKICPTARCFHISDLSMNYTTDKYTTDIFNNKQYELDSKYENEIDSDNVTEFNDIELRVNTFNPHAGSYSYVVHLEGNNHDYLEQITNTNTSKSYISEEHIINKYHNYYREPKFIYNNTIAGADRITPLTKFHENTLNKNFRSNSLNYDLNNNSVDISANEI